MIKFQNEEMMKKWAAGLDQQRKENAPQIQQIPDKPPANFAWIASQEDIKNPYYEPEDNDDDDEPTGSISGTTLTPSQYGAPVSLPGTMQRHPSSTSLRQRSLTNDSPHSMAGIARGAPPRFPMPGAQATTPLCVQTQSYQASSLPPTDSYFSPVPESPASSRASTTSGIFTGGPGSYFPKASQSYARTPDENTRYTSPALPRAPSRDGPSPANGFGMAGPNGRTPRGPSMPVMPRDSTHSAQFQQQRSRSYSTPDINGQASTRNGQSVPAVPGIPPHLHQAHPSHPAHVRHDSNIPRSNTGSPANELPIRTNTNSPGTQRTRQYSGDRMAHFPSQPIYPRMGTPGSAANLPPPGPPPVGLAPLAPGDPMRAISPGLGMPPIPDITMPNQLKVKVNYESGNYFTLVAQFNIAYQSLVDRIDVKLARLTNSSIARGDLKLRYQDEDGDFVTIESDEDIQIAISDWREGPDGAPGGLGEIELFCVGDLT